MGGFLDPPPDRIAEGLARTAVQPPALPPAPRDIDVTVSPAGRAKFQATQLAAFLDAVDAWRVTVDAALTGAHAQLTGRSELGAHPATAIGVTPAAGMVSTNVQAALAEIAALASTGGFVTCVKTEDTATDNDALWPTDRTSLVLDPHLQAEIGVGTWAWTASLHYTAGGSTLGRMRLAVTSPTGSTGRWCARCLAVGANSSQGSMDMASRDINGGQPSAGAAGPSVPVFATPTGFVTVTSPGVFGLRWGQNANDTTSPDPAPTTLLAGSVLTLQKVA